MGINIFFSVFMHLTEHEDIWPTWNLITSLPNQYINFNSFLFIIHPLFLTTHHASPVLHRANTEKQTTVHSGIQNNKTKTNEPITHCFCVYLYCYLIIWLSQSEHKCLSHLWAKTAQICLICKKAVLDMPGSINEQLDIWVKECTF